VFWILAGLLVLLLSKSYLLQSDEGHILSAAWQIWNGRRMYDEFQHYFGPASGYAVYLTWLLTGGPSFLAARILSLALALSSAVAGYLMLCGRGIRGATLALAIAAWIAADSLYVPINHNSFSSFAAAWLLFAFLRAQDRDRAGDGRLRDHLWVGVAAGAVTLFLQTKGLLLLGATAAFTLVAGARQRGPRVAAALTVLAGGAAVLAPLLLVWRPSVLLREWFIVPMTGDYLGHTGASRPLALACVAVTGAVGATAIRFRDRLLLAVAVFQVALVAGFLYNVELAHVAINCFPLAVFVPLALQRRAAGRGAPPAAAPADARLATATMALIVGMLAIVMATPVGRPAFQLSALDVDFIRRPSRNLFPQPKVAAAHAIYAGPFMPGLYFQLGKKNPFFYSETLVCGAACRQQLLAKIREVRPEIAFLEYEMVAHLRYDADNVVDRYFRDSYVLCPTPATARGPVIVRAVDASWCP
jgi:hypothetical protein